MDFKYCIGEVVNQKNGLRFEKLLYINKTHSIEKSFMLCNTKKTN